MTLPAINLRARSSYSIMRSAMIAKKVPALAVAADQPAVALVDRHSLAGAYEFAVAARKAGVQPIVGSDFETVDGFVTLIAEDASGWASLLALSRLQAASPERLIDHDAVIDHAQGLLLLAGAPDSALIGMVAADRAAANDWLKRMMAAFPDRLFLEVDRAEERRPSEAVLDRISRAYSLPMVGTSPAACRADSDYEILELLAAIDQKQLIDDPDLVRPERGQHFKDQDALRALFADAPHLLENAARLALRCSDDSAPRAAKPMLPRYPDAHGDEDGMMRRMAAEGFEARIADVPEDRKQAYRDRLAAEADVICSQGFAGYFLIVADFIGWAKAADIPVGPGRGSGAGSAVAWALGITDLDPIRWGLLFERFINPDRVSLPDFDVDFCQSRREEVVAYVRAKYGEDKVVAIGTVGSWKSRSAFKDAARALGIPNGAAHGASQLIPTGPKFPAYDLSATSEDQPGFLPPEVRAHFRENAALERALVMAEPLQGFVRQRGRHAAGIIISDPDVGDVVPVMRDPGGGDDFVTQFDMKGVEDCGLVKFDFLGLKTSTVIHEAVRHVRASSPELADLEILDIPFEDDAIFEMLNKGDCQGVFQLEEDGMVRSLKQIRPTTWEDLVAIISLYRPGPMDNIPSYANRKNGAEPVQVPHPKLKDLLAETQGIIVYQEQVMRAAQILAGYTLAEADLLRRAMGKKIPAEMAAQRERFVQGCTTQLAVVETATGKKFSMPPSKELARVDGSGDVTPMEAQESGAEVIIGDLRCTVSSVSPASCARIDEKRAGELFDLVDKFSGYGFNKSHAAAYALLLWQTAWLKCHHPAAFYSAALTYADGDFDKMRKIIREARERGMEFLPPSVDRSTAHFSPETTADGKPAVRWGLAAIKGVGSYARPLVAACRGRGMTRIEDVAKAMTAQGNATGPIRALAAAGALEELNRNRNAAAEHFILCLREEGKQTGQDFLFAIASPACPDVPDMSAEEKRAAEIEALGISFHEHPLSGAFSEIRRLQAVQLARIDDYAGCGAVTVLARVEAITRSPRGSTVYARLSDATGEIEAVVEQVPSVGDLVVCELARKTSEPRWRLVDQRRFSASSTPQRMRVDVKASHDWERLRKQLVAGGRGDDRIDVMIDLGEKKARKVLPSCFVVTPELVSALAANPDVIGTRTF